MQQGMARISQEFPQHPRWRESDERSCGINLWRPSWELWTVQTLIGSLGGLGCPRGSGSEMHYESMIQVSNDNIR